MLPSGRDVLSTATLVAACVGALPGVGPTAWAAALDEGDARRFLTQASFGPTEASTQALMASGKRAWLQQQFGLPTSDYTGLPAVDHNSAVGCPAGAVVTCQRDNYSLFPLPVRFSAGR